MSKEANPYRSFPDLRLVTASRYKQMLASSSGIQVEFDPTKQSQVTNGEFNHDKTHSCGIAVPYLEGQTPYCVSVAKAKAEELIKGLSPNGHHHLVVDSTWTGYFDDRHVRVAFNKPSNNGSSVEEAVRLFKQLRGYPLISETGLAVISPDLEQITHYHTILNAGKVKKDLDLGVVENLLNANPETSAGFSLSEALEHIVEQPKFILFEIRQCQPDRFLGGGLVNKSKYELSLESGNLEQIKMFAVGIMPKY